ncbi:CoA transferase subunit A [Nitrospirillum bahiense]|uniref:Glutaconate CoA-transferase subunit A n=1 Tax=Nitrospirillum amazonense TaxID=28077 RepID=A0A560FVL3_9PROT|nr:CoA-transferase [Nitrospirillum amazonense]TWB25677.1 glutaconate CoA-transferase subunit A [Nitrospirillum amazonense]
MLDKRMTLDDIVDQLSDGMTIGIGGWATRRKPMALVRALLRSRLKDLTLVSYGGPDVGLLAAAGKLRRLVFAFVSLDHYPLDPHFRAARQEGLDVLELDEGMFHLGLRAAAMRVPFLPTHIGIGTDIIRQPAFRTVRSPYEDGEELVAVPALPLDATLLHLHRADALGNVLTLSPDPFFDELMARAAKRVFVTTEKLVPTPELDMANNARFNLCERALISGVAEAPFGAHPTSAAPDYQLDLGHLKTYADSAASPEGWADYRARFIDVGADHYLDAIGGAGRVAALPKPVY